MYTVEILMLYQVMTESTQQAVLLTELIREHREPVVTDSIRAAADRAVPVDREAMVDLTSLQVIWEIQAQAVIMQFI